MRLDALVVQRGLASTRARARALILAGQVRVDDVVRSKAGTPVTAAARVTLIRPDHGYVGRGGVKLAHALDAFGIPMRDRLVLDIGASTGGFTDAALERGARRVAALDVGRGQIAWKLRQDARVTVLDGINARYLTADRLPADVRTVDGRHHRRLVHLGDADPARGPPAARGRRRRRRAGQAAVRGRPARDRQAGRRPGPGGAPPGGRPRRGRRRCARIDAGRGDSVPHFGSRGQPGGLSASPAPSAGGLRR